jgi:lysophospholipase L1-like esterase
MSAEPASAPKKSRRRFIRPILLAFLLIGFAASIFLNVRLYQQATQNYTETSAVQLDPYGLKYADFPPDKPAGASSKSLPTILFFGDSRARGWTAPNVPGYRFVNRGIGGQTTEQVRGRFDAHVAPLSPRVIVLQAGINDLKAIPLLPARRDQIVADCKANLRNIVTRARAAGVTVIVTTIFPPGDVPLERRALWSADVEKCTEEVNAELRSLACDGVIVLDAWKLLESNGRLRDGLGIDTLHLNAKGYEVMNGELEKLIRSMDSSTRPSPIQ